MIKHFKLDLKNLPTLSLEQKLKLDTPAASEPDEDNPFLSSQDYEKISKVVFIKSVRKKLGLTQADFAKIYHITPARLRDWEQGRRKPDDMAMSYLKIIETIPQDVQNILSR